MRPALILAVGLLLQSLPGAAAQPAVEKANAPYVMIRTLQTLQEQMAHGNGAAQAAQPKLLAHMAESFVIADPRCWSEPRNGRAAIQFLLSGGKPSVIRAIMERANMPPELDTLLKGALAYGEGQDDIARSLLGSVDINALPETLGGHVALIEATLLSGQDNAKANKLLDLARLLVPGTLVEEAALRRQIFLVADTGDLDKFTALSRQYVRRFRNSIYVENFNRRFTAMAAATARSGDLGKLAKLDQVITELTPAAQRQIYLGMARTATILGKTEAARVLAEKAIPLTKDHAADEARAKLYIGSSLIVSDGYDRGVSALRATDASLLPPDDVELRKAALSVSALVRAEAEDPDQDGADGNRPASSNPSQALLTEARKSLSDSDALLKGSAR